MANGDIAVAEAGFTAVKSTDDFRLGYDRINEAADLAVRRGIRSFTTKAAMNAVNGKFVGDLAMCQADGIQYRWGGATWRPWNSGWINYTPGWQNVTQGANGAGTAIYRWENGLIRVLSSLTLGSSSAFSATGVTTNLPTTPLRLGPMLGGRFMIRAGSGGAIYNGELYCDGSSGGMCYCLVYRADQAFLVHASLFNNSPIAASQGTEMRFEGVYEDATNFIGAT